MKEIKVLGGGCKNCENTADLIKKKATEASVEINMEKVTDMADIMSYGVMSTPAVVIDGKVVHAGGVPSSDDVKKWLDK